MVTCSKQVTTYKVSARQHNLILVAQRVGQRELERGRKGEVSKALVQGREAKRAPRRHGAELDRKQTQILQEEPQLSRDIGIL